MGGVKLGLFSTTFYIIIIDYNLFCFILFYDILFDYKFFG